MPKKTLALIAGLVLVTVILAIIAYRTGQQTQKYPQQQPPKQQSEADVAHSTLVFSPNPVEVGSGQVGTIEVNLDTSDNPVSAVQLGLLYDPTMITNVKAVPGPMFTNPGLDFTKNDTKTGHLTYMLGIQPGQKQKPVSGKGVAVIITFTARGTVGQQSQISLVPKETLVSARGVAKSVLKESSGTTVVIGSSTGTTGQTQGTTQTIPVSPVPTQ